MAITFTTRRKRQRILIGIFVGMIILSVGVLYFGFLRKPQISPEPALPSAASISQERIGIDFNFLQTETFESLALPPIAQTEAVTAGRDNPFLPFE